MSNRIYKTILAASCVLALQCGLFEPREDKGSIAIMIQHEGMAGLAKPLEMLNSVRYVLKQGSTTVRDGYLSRNGNYFESTISDLEPGSYSVDVYGYNSSGGLVGTGSSGSVSVTAGNTATAVISWVSSTTGTITDIDGNVYHTVTIGTQVWTVENLRVTHYRNGDAISNVTSASAWQSLTTGAYCDYNNNSGYVSTYGRLYNWYAVADSRNIAPAGWHVPTDAEWTTLENYLGGESVAGGKMKEAGTTHWSSPNTGATNESGFSALPGGTRYLGGTFDSMGSYAHFWSSSEGDAYDAWYRYLHYGYAGIARSTTGKRSGFSVRLVRD